MKNSPRISVVTTNKNGGNYLRETIESVMRQSFQDFEHIIVDSASTDDSLEIIKSYPHIRWISEKDNSANEGFEKGFAMAKGEFIMVMSVSDVYSSCNWFRRCVEVLDSDPEVSLVWGSAAQMSEEGEITQLWQPWWLEFAPPQKRRFFDYAMATDGYLPELNYCVRKDIFLQCYQEPVQQGGKLLDDLFLAMSFNFITRGYLPYFLPVVAHFGRQHAGQISEVQKQKIRAANLRLRTLQREYVRAVIFGEKKHVFRNGESSKIGELSKADRVLLLPRIFAIKCYVLLNKIFRSTRITKYFRVLIRS